MNKPEPKIVHRLRPYRRIRECTACGGGSSRGTKTEPAPPQRARMVRKRIMRRDKSLGFGLK